MNSYMVLHGLFIDLRAPEISTSCGKKCKTVILIYFINAVNGSKQFCK